MATLLTAFPLVADDSRAAGSDVLPRALRRARDHVDEHLHEPISVVDIADAARVSVRTLEYQFKRHFGLSPSAYLRDTRLHAAHRDLLDADPQRDTVAAIAHRWAFGNPGRFAALHRARYGENPSATLHR